MSNVFLVWMNKWMNAKHELKTTVLSSAIRRDELSNVHTAHTIFTTFWQHWQRFKRFEASYHVQWT